MKTTQPRTSLSSEFALKTERLGPLPLVNHFLERMGLEELLEQYVPTKDRRCAVAHSRALGVLLRSIVVEREPIYRQAETVHGFASGLYGLSARQIGRMDDDRLGRALDQLFQADRAALLTAVVLAVARRFEVRFERLHNDSTSISFCGQYRDQRPNRFGRSAAAITYGYSKDHRPDLKQLLFILTTDADAGVPVQFRAADGNTNDSVTHIDTWNSLRAVAGRADFLYVADSKLCSFDNLDYIHRAGGRFVTVMPRSRREDAHFRKWIQTRTPEWELVWDRPHPRHSSTGPRDRWLVYRDPLGSREGWSLLWVWSTLLTLHQQDRRHRNLAAATEALTSLRARVLSTRSRLRGAARIDLAVEQILERYHVRRYLKVKRTVRQEHSFKQARRGRPGPNTAYRRITRRRYDLEWTLDQAAVAYDEKSDGMYPLLTNDRNLTPAQVLEAHKGQPTIEKRFEQLKTVHEIAPVFLKNPFRIEAFFTLYFLALLVQALIERELRLAMKRNRIRELPIYPEQRLCKRPTTEQILRLFSFAERHTLMREGRLVQIFPAELTDLQSQVLELLGVPLEAFRG
ncbi:MAG TPA: IS1634 family transposase [Steroidobacteraceae bacterium]